jgi:hypothetical protein
MADAEIRDWRATTSAGVQQRMMAVTEPEVMDSWLAMNEAVVEVLEALVYRGVGYEDAVGMIAGSVSANLAQHRLLHGSPLGEA